MSTSEKLQDHEERGCATGRLSEHRVLKIVRSLASKDGNICSAEISSRDDDLRGIDIWINTADGGMIPLQVKTSIRELRRHRRRYPQIPAVATRHLYGPESDEFLARRIQNIVRRYDRLEREYGQERLPE